MPGTILIVDDSMVNRKLLSKTLAGLGHEIIEARDGKEALERSFELLPDLILLDIIMPEIEGFEVCSALKADERTADIPIIFLSARSEVKDKIKGLEIGAVDYITKPFDRGEVLARVQNQLKIRALTKDLMEKQARLDEDLKAAAGIQGSLLPRKLPDVENLEMVWKFTPCEMIGGDIFNVLRLDESHLGFYILDVSGHGVPSAMVTVSVSQMFQTHSGSLVKRQKGNPPFYEIVQPRHVLQQLDREYPLDRFDKYFTIVYAVLNVHTGHLSYSNAAHPCPVLLHADGTLELLDKGGTIIGLDGAVPFEEGELDLHRGDKLFLYTDGLTEYQNDEGGFFGQDRFHDLLASLRDRSLSVILDRVYEAMTQFGNRVKLQDDVSILGIEFKG
ncbi:MAG: hypothetical protein AUK55_15485 [Syntrophobacteraceae bacterium CG2_30_61_12]|nr:MAG: hypothetical protein AUK55_15485 [Syntrophobacteraceae bacterium CG2_30_61_12]